MMVASRSRFPARALSDALCLYLIPVCAALLPWRAGFALLKLCARIAFLHRDSVESLWASASALCPGADERAWKRHARLLLLVEHTDTYLTVLRTDRWWRRHLAIRGQFPAAGAANLLLTYHWGTGNWIWRVLRAHGIRAYFLARRPHGRSLGLSRLSTWYGALRARTLRRAGSMGVIFTGDSAGTIRQALAEGRSLIGMLDLGVGADQRGADGTLLGRPVRLPFGLARIAHETGTAVTLFSVGVDWKTGARDLAIEVLPADAGVELIMARYIAHLDRRLATAPEAWLMWHEAHAIFGGAHAGAKGASAIAVAPDAPAQAGTSG